MGNRYDDAWLDLLYDIDTEVRIANGGVRYPVLSGTDKIFPGGVFPEWEELVRNGKYSWEPKSFGQKGSWNERRGIKIDGKEIGTIYPVRIVHKIAHIREDLRQVRDSLNFLTLDNDEFESAKYNLFNIIESAGLTPKTSRLSLRLSSRADYL